MTKIINAGFRLLGLALIVYGCSLVSGPLALVATGVSIIVVAKGIV